VSLAQDASWPKVDPSILWGRRGDSVRVAAERPKTIETSEESCANSGTDRLTNQLRFDASLVFFEFFSCRGLLMQDVTRPTFLTTYSG
jgi:hypothetical protein